MSKQTISTETMNLINVAIKKAVAQAVKAKDEQSEQETNYYRQLQKILYLYPKLEIFIKESEEYIRCLEIEGVPEKSKDIVMMPVGGSYDKPDYDEIVEERLQNRRNSLKRTEIDFNWITTALNRLKSEDSLKYQIIKHRYFKNQDIDTICFECSISRSTFFRYHKEATNILGIYLFGSLGL